MGGLVDTDFLILPENDKQKASNKENKNIKNDPKIKYLIPVYKVRGTRSSHSVFLVDMALMSYGGLLDTNHFQLLRG